MINTRAVQSCENNINPEPPRVVVLAATTAKEIFPEERSIRSPELAARWVQNNTGAAVYLSFGISTAGGLAQCDNMQLYNAVIQDQQLFDCTFVGRCRICAYSVLGGNVSTTTLRRYDFGHSVKSIG